MSRNNATVIFFILILLGSCLHPVTASADTIYLNNGGAIKGIIVDDTAGYLKVETALGYIDVDKENIAQIQYLSEAENYLSLGNDLYEAGKTDRALVFYKKALRLEPGLEAAKSRLTEVQEQLAEEERKLRQQQERLEREKVYLNTRLKERWGMYFAPNSRGLQVEDIQPFSPASLSCLKLGDVIYKVAGRDIQGENLNKVFNILLDKDKIDVMIYRQISLSPENIVYNYRSVKGLGVFVTKNGVKTIIDEVLEDTPADKAGIHVNDYIVEIGGQAADKLRLADIASLTSEYDRLLITISRKVNLQHEQTD